MPYRRQTICPKPRRIRTNNPSNSPQKHKLQRVRPEAPPFFYFRNHRKQKKRKSEKRIAGPVVKIWRPIREICEDDRRFLAVWWICVLMLAVLYSFSPTAWTVEAVSNTCVTCYIDYENGNDLWSGTAETFQGGTIGPWKHAPGMLGLTPSGGATGDACANNCASQVPVAGDKYILKGGDVWPYTTGPWAPYQV